MADGRPSRIAARPGAVARYTREREAAFGDATRVESRTPACECSDSRCHSTVALHPQAYAAIRPAGVRLVLARHERRESVVGGCDRFSVVHPGRVA